MMDVKPVISQSLFVSVTPPPYHPFFTKLSLTLPVSCPTRNPMFQLQPSRAANQPLSEQARCAKKVLFVIVIVIGPYNIPMAFVFTKCDKTKAVKGKRPNENVRDFQELIRENNRQHPPWIMTSSVTGLGRDELLLHMSQLRNYWDL